MDATCDTAKQRSNISTQFHVEKISLPFALLASTSESNVQLAATLANTDNNKPKQVHLASVAMEFAIFIYTITTNYVLLRNNNVACVCVCV